jgi:hypothetical protein
MSTQYANGKIINSGLVLALDAADRNSYPGSGTTWNDVSGNGNSGSLINGPTYSSANGGSIQFDGSNDYVNCGSNASTLLTSITINATFSFAAYSSTHVIVGRLGNPSGGYRHNYFYGITNSRLYFGFKQASASAYPYIWIDNIVTLNKIYNFTVTYSVASSIGVYLSGQPVSYSGPNTVSNPIITNQIMDTDISSTTCGVGSGVGESTYYSNAKIYNVQIYNRALLASEVLQNYNATKTRFGL